MFQTTNQILYHMIIYYTVYLSWLSLRIFHMATTLRAGASQTSEVTFGTLQLQLFLLRDALIWDLG